MPDDKDVQLNKSLENQAGKIKEKERPEIMVEQSGIGAEKEKKVEAQIQKEPALIEKEMAVKDEGEPGGMVAISNLAQKRQQREKQIENILSEDLEDIYLHMPPDKQAEFRKAGEEVGREINSLLDRAKGG